MLVSNPEVRPYKPEDFEVIIINFYKALNYLQMNNMEDALVEVRKINIRLQQLNDKYPDHKNRYQQDAFAQLLMGLIYDAAGDANNAYTAGTTVGSYLAELGFNLDFAPAADLKVVDGNAAGSSSYGTDAATVASFVTGMQTGLQEQKVTAAIGHFPGIGSTTQSTKNGMASTDRSCLLYTSPSPRDS